MKPSRRIVQARLADGSDATLLGATLIIDWFGELRPVRADIVPAIRPANARPLVGCRLLRDSRLEIDSLAAPFSCHETEEPDIRQAVLASAREILSPSSVVVRRPRRSWLRSGEACHRRSRRLTERPQRASEAELAGLS